MRVEVNVERNDREFRTIVECDQGIEWDVALQACVNAMDAVMGGYKAGGAQNV